MVLISIGVGAIAKRFFGKNRNDKDEDVQGDHPIARALFRAMNSDEFDDLEAVIDDDCEVYANGFRLSRGSVDHGPELITGSMRAFREELPDVRWKLYDELAGKDNKTDKLALRFVSRATIDGDDHQVEVAAFAILEDDKVTEWREVLDMTLSNERRAASGLPLIE